MQNKQIQAACDFINANVRGLHGFNETVDLQKHVGPDIGPDNVVKAEERQGEVVLLVDRGIKGVPRYKLNADDVQQHADQQKATVKVVSSKTESKPKAKRVTPSKEDK